MKFYVTGKSVEGLHMELLPDTLILWSKIVFNRKNKMNKFMVWLQFKGALDNILKFSLWLNFIYHVKIDC